MKACEAFEYTLIVERISFFAHPRWDFGAMTGSEGQATPPSRGVRLTRISHAPLTDVARALVRAVSRLISTPCWPRDAVSNRGVGMSADAARKSACATILAPNSCEKCGLTLPAAAEIPLRRHAGCLCLAVVLLKIELSLGNSDSLSAEQTGIHRPCARANHCQGSAQCR